MPPDTPLHFRDILRPLSRLRYAIWRLRKSRERLTIQLKSGLSLSVRPFSSTDYGVAYDIFFRHCYASPRALESVKNIVDLGSNVGYSCLFWCSQYPEAHITAFEPHPIHVEAIALNLSLNAFTSRVEVVPVAVEITSGSAHLSDAGSSSAINDRNVGHLVPVVDLFATLNGRIDILKIDIEGGEYLLLEDERFGALDVQVVVVEWHKRDDSTQDRTWCEQALQKWGVPNDQGRSGLPTGGPHLGISVDLIRMGLKTRGNGIVGLSTGRSPLVAGP